MGDAATVRPTIESKRLILRPFMMSDANAVQTLAGHPLIFATTASIPHPYLDGMAEAWIGTHEDIYLKGLAVQFAVVSKVSRELIGNVSTVLRP